MLLITALSGPWEGQIVAGGIYPSHAACREAIKPVGATLDMDYKSECVPTGALSASPRPKPRATVSRD